MEYYNDKIAKNHDVELILMAGEEDDELADWAKKEAMPWPMLKQRDYARMKTIKDIKPNGWPSYYLLDADGEMLIKDGAKQEIMDKIEELTKSTTS